MERQEYFNLTACVQIVNDKGVVISGATTDTAPTSDLQKVRDLYWRANCQLSQVEKPHTTIYYEFAGGRYEADEINWKYVDAFATAQEVLDVYERNPYPVVEFAIVMESGGKYKRMKPSLNELKRLSGMDRNDAIIWAIKEF